METIKESLSLGLHEYVSYKLRRIRDPESIRKILLWEELVFQRCEENLKKHVEGNPNTFKETSQAGSAVKQLKQCFTICPVDKTTHNLSLVCKAYYQYIVSKEMSSKAYVVVEDESLEQILDRHQVWCHKMGHEDNFSRTLPYLYALPKLHKTPVKWRFIAGTTKEILPKGKLKINPIDIGEIYHRKPHVARNSLTEASTFLSEQLQEVMKILQLKDSINFKKTNIRRCWFTRSAEDVFQEVKHQQDYLKTKRPRTFDFTTMYTCLPQKRIIENLQAAIKEAKDFAQSYNSNENKGRLIGLNLASTNRLMEHVKFIVSNTYFNSGDGLLRHREIGLPMGTNSAPELANLTLYVDEAKHIDTLIEEEKIEEAIQNASNFRLIDDVLCWDIEPPSPLQYGLDWKETTEEDGSVTYLGAKIQVKNGFLTLSVFDKALEWPFDIIRYPHAVSNVPYHQPAGVIQGQLHRFRSICNSISAFKQATTQLVLRMLFRGHKPSIIMKGWNGHLAKFNNDRITNYTRLRHWFRRMLEWAIHHPIQAKKVWIPKKSANHTNDPLQDDNIPLASQLSEAMQNKLDSLDTVVCNVEPEHTPFEKDLIRFRNDHRLSPEILLSIDKLLNALTRRDTRVSSQVEGGYICPKCDQRYASEKKTQTSAHFEICQRAKEVKAAISDLSQNDMPYRGDGHLIGSTNSEGFIHQSNPSPAFVNPFMEINPKLNKKVIEILNALQNEEEGSFFHLVGQLFQLCPPSNDVFYRIRNKEDSGGYTFTFQMFHILLAGVSFHPSNESTSVFRRNSSSHKWLTDEHINLIRELIHHDQVIPWMNIPHKFSPTSYCLQTYFYPKLCGDDKDKQQALMWLREALFIRNLFSDDEFRAE